MNYLGRYSTLAVKFRFQGSLWDGGSGKSNGTSQIFPKIMDSSGPPPPLDFAWPIGCLAKSCKTITEDFC